uniref:threonine synthase n=1 Tax=Porphyrobacter sp. GA68 TaxID=2883480 RepID=UPI001D18B75C|nr:pyridoxal-phosphate dependent enzyme [Porphyrobacter sp. GA68]
MNTLTLSTQSRSRQRHALNPELAGFECISCSLQLEIADFPEGCPSCFARGEPSTVRSRFRTPPSAVADPSRQRMQRYEAWMPYASWISLGEGGTPCTSIPALADQQRVRAIYIKNEGLNPSGSHKDRTNCLVVTRALDIGATGVVAASSGNGGASLALYAAAAGLPCRIVVTPALSPIFRRAITVTGAEIIEVSDSLDRWRRVADMSKSAGWFAATNYLDPPVGSNHFGLQGLKTIAYEMFEEFGPDLVDVIVVPTSRGDLIWGIHEGFRDLAGLGLTRVLPRLYAVEPFARISEVLAGAPVTGSFPGTTALASIGGSTVTYQAVAAIRASRGGAVVVDDQAVARDQERLARQGCFAESSSAAGLSAVDRLRAQDRVSSEETVALIVTSTGYKDTPPGEAWS